MRRISFLLTLCLLLLALTGCGGTNNAGNTAEPSVPETEQTEPEDSPEAPEAPEEQPSAEQVPEQPTEELGPEKPAEEPSEETPAEEPEQPETAEPEEPAPEETSAENPYSACTEYSKEAVEDFAAQVRQAVLDRDWESLSRLTCYDIRVGEHTFGNSSEFAVADWDSILDEDFFQAIEEESCTDLFCNASGVMMGGGQIWFGQVLDIDGNDQGLQVTVINP